MTQTPKHVKTTDKQEPKVWKTLTPSNKMFEKKNFKALILLNLLVTQANEGNCKGDNIERVQGKAEKVQ